MRTLLGLLVVIPLILPLVRNEAGGMFVEILLSVILLTALWNMSQDRQTLRYGLLLGVPAILFRYPLFIIDNDALWVLSTALRVAFIGFVTFALVKRVGTEQSVTTDTIIGAMNGFLLLALLWALVFTTLEIIQPGSFSIHASPDLPPDALADSYFPDFFYFSLVTLTTLGYGDINPLSDLARTLSAYEAVAGQLYIGVLIARLISIHATRGE
jgi:voltage-gated potassium channel Kch